MGVVSCGTTMLDQGVFENIGAVTWDTTAKTSGFTGVSGNGYFVNTTSGSVTVTLPASPSAGDIVGIKDYANTADTNKIVIGRNGSNIQGIAANFDIVTEGGSVLLVYVDGTQGWKVTSSSQASNIRGPFVCATGGTITTCGDYRIHTFTGPGTFTVNSAGGPAGSTQVDYLTVAGGGGGGSRFSGGGGAGGYRESGGTVSGCYSVSPLGSGVSAFSVSATAYPITVGAGGAGGPGSGGSGTNGANDGSSGSSSSAFPITSAGGGGGGAGDSRPGLSGGSGGGGAGRFPSSAGSGNTPPVSPPQGSNGGSSGGAAPHAGAGGGGATSVGGNSAGGNGGNGATSSINASPVTRAGGGGGGGSPAAPTGAGSGGPGGGGGGSTTTAPGTPGTINTGGGGGGGSYVPPAPGNYTGGNGGSGLVIIRYKFQ